MNSSMFKTTLLFTTLTLLLIFIGGWIAGTSGAIIFFIIAATINFISYWYSDKIVLMMYRAKEVNPAQAPSLHNIVERLAINAKIPKPRVFIIPTDAPNAFATGRNPQNAVVAVTQGMLKILDQDELEGVISHELAHIRNRDILISTIAATMAGAIGLLMRNFLWFGIFGGRNRNGNPIITLVLLVITYMVALFTQMAISRTREYGADKTGAKISGKPLGLANALLKLDAYSERMRFNATPGTSHMFIVNPFKGSSFFSFSTHPPIKDRVERLKKLAYEI